MPSCVTVATCSISKFAFPHEKQVYEFDWRTEGEFGEHLGVKKEVHENYPMGQWLLNLYALLRRDFICYSHFQGLLKMRDLRLGAFYGSLGFECHKRTGLEENGSGIPRNYKSTPDVSN